jgi:ribosomal peptide maturation radical SAM protein 1
MVQVCLVQMPYSAVERPSMALGLLKAYLSSANISAHVLYANLEFAETVGLDVYKAIEDTPAESLIGEWTFARAAFPEAGFDDAAFIDEVGPRLDRFDWFAHMRKIHPTMDSVSVLTTVRERSVAFVDRIAREVLQLGPSIVGCTSMFQQHCGSLALLRRVKELAPDVVTMLGGANCEGSMGEVTHREFRWVDFVVSGEADGFFADLCRDILDNGSQLDPRELPQGVFGPRSRSRLRMTGDPPRAVVTSLEDTASPDYDEYFESLAATTYGPYVKPSLLFESSRGCWWGMKHHCTFCGLNGEGMTFRAKPAARVLDELSALRRRYGIRWMQAVDNIMDSRHLTTLLPKLGMLEEPYYLFYEVKANLKHDQLRLLGAAGVRRIQPGIESLHDDVLKLLDKGNNCLMNLQLLKWAQEFGIRVSWNFLSGAPGESEEWYREISEILPLIHHLEPPSQSGLAEIRYDRFSVYFKEQDRYGLRLVPNRAYAHVYPLPTAALHELAYFFEDAAHPGPRIDGPAHADLSAAINDWRQAFLGSGGGPRARLTASDDGERAVVHDTRPHAVVDRIVLEGVDYAVWKACESACSPDSLRNLPASDGRSAGAAEIAEAVERLRQLKLLVEWRGRVLSLAVREPVIPYLKGDEVPGYTDLGKLFKTLTRTSLARECVRLPGDVPLAELFASAAAPS